MPDFYTEHRSLPEGTSMSLDLARHIFARNARGCVVVVSTKPKDLASVLKKQWRALIRLVQKERSSTIKIVRIAELSSQISWMQNLHFLTKFTGEFPDNSIVFATADDLVRKPPICSTLYVTQLLTNEQMHLIASWLERSSVMVIYDTT